MIDVLSLNNSRFSDYLLLIYPIELEVKTTIDKAVRVNENYDICDDFTFPIVNFSFSSSNIPAAPANIWRIHLTTHT
jgi:hypothetical protein